MCQLNPNAWRLIVSMQVLWKEVFEGDRPLIMDEFLFCYKPFEINQFQGFYQFTTRGNDCRLIKSLVSSYRNWKTEFFFVSGFWSRHPVEICRDPFAHYTGELGKLHPEGIYYYFFILYIMFLSFAYNCLTLFFFFLVVG